jgi:hypothetical protein
MKSLRPSIYALVIGTFHSEITQAAVDTLGSDSALARLLGPETERLRDFCWMADWRRQLHREAGVWFYTDDYLLFPEMTTHRDHICPDVEKTYEPYFRRALQALRTETPANAVRWIGSIMHFTEDTGSPPHAAQIRGDVHSKMENWVDAKAIHLPGYRPQSFGATDDEAVAGFVKRMNGLIAFSKERAERAKPFVLSGDRAATEPIVLESALETSRVVADLLFTLGELANKGSSGDGADLHGTVSSTAAPGLEKIPAKVMLVGTDFSTLADPDSHYEFHHLPSGNFQVCVLKAGSAITTAEVLLASNQAVEHDFALPADSTSGNLVRNSSLATVWISAKQPDAWYPVKSPIDGTYWEGEMLPLEKGKTYRLKVSWKQPAGGRVSVRLRKSGDLSKLPEELGPISPNDAPVEFKSDGGFAQVLIFTDGAASAVAGNIALAPVD